MEQYIKKSNVKTEIERRIKEIDEIGTYLSPKGALTNFLCYIDTLEVKNVNLEEEVDKKLEECNWEFDKIDFYKFAQYFYELGLKAKGE